VRHAWKNHALDVLHHAFERFAMLGSALRQGSADLPRLGLRQNGKRFDASVIIRDPVHHFFAVPPEILRRHSVVGFLRHSIHPCTLPRRNASLKK